MQRIKYIPQFAELIRKSTYAKTETNIEGLNRSAKAGVKAIHTFVTGIDGYTVGIFVRDKEAKQYLYEVKFIESKKSPQQSMARELAFPAPKGDAEDKGIVSQEDSIVNGENKENAKKGERPH